MSSGRQESADKHGAAGGLHGVIFVGEIGEVGETRWLKEALRSTGGNTHLVMYLILSPTKWRCSSICASLEARHESPSCLSNEGKD